jgi:hypothetical protein
VGVLVVEGFFSNLVVIAGGDYFHAAGVCSI